MAVEGGVKQDQRNALRWSRMEAPRPVFGLKLTAKRKKDRKALGREDLPQCTDAVSGPASKTPRLHCKVFFLQMSRKRRNVILSALLYRFQAHGSISRNVLEARGSFFQPRRRTRSFFLVQEGGALTGLLIANSSINQEPSKCKLLI